MATSPATSYSSRPYSCSRPTKIISVRQLRSRKVTTTTESPQKIDIVTRSKRLQTTVNSTSTRRYTSNKIYKDASRRDESSKMKKMSDKEEKTYERKKGSVIISSNLSKDKRKRNVIKNKEAINNPAKLRQMSLKESFTRQPVSNRLRPRQNKRNYREDSKLLQQYLPTKQQNSIVMLEKLDSRDIDKVPVYKTIRTSEVHSEDNNDIYDFTYDSNDTKEKLTKKRKRNVKKVGKKKIVKNVIRKKITARPEATSGGKKSSDHGAKHSIEIQSEETEAVAPTLFLESKKENASDKIEIDTPKTTDAENTEMQIVDEVASSDQRPTEQIGKRDTRKPKIVSIENANNIAVVRSPGNSEDIQPFRPTNIFHNKNKSALSCSLLTKSLSPISKTCNVFDPGSPWRSPAVPMFYQTKHFIQSTPNVSKIDTVQAKLKRHIKDDSYNNDKIANISDVMSKDINPTMQNVSDRQNRKKKPNPCRKFGTEITNIGPNNSSLNQDNTEIVHDKEPSIQTKPVSNQNVQPDAIASGSSNYSSFDDTDDKENAAPNYQTPKKSTKKGTKQRHLPDSFKTCETKSKSQRENVEPQPGPSNPKDSDRRDRPKTSHQSNLNNFLNITDMPENTSISTKHGIFGDTQSTPINNNVVEKMNKSTIELENAFGFCEEGSELDISSIENKLVSNDTSKPLVQSSTRWASRESRNHSLPKKPNSNDDNEYKRNKIDNENVHKSPLVQKDKRLVDTVNFSDTFDVLSESERPSNRETDVPLFVDLEPSRFSKPPHHTYKRKRGVTFDSLEDNGEEGEKEDVRTHTKKKKFTKLEKENKRRLDEWVKIVNSTFQEIDEYDLIVE